MRINITARHFSPSDKLKDLVHSKISKLEKFNYGIMNCHIILKKEGNIESVEIVCHAKGNEFIAHGNLINFEKSLVDAIEKIAVQAKKYNQKITSHK